MSLLSTLMVACTLSTLVLSGDYGKNDRGKYVKTARPTKYEPHSYDDGMSNWEKPSYPKPSYSKTKKLKPTKYLPPNQGWKKDFKPTSLMFESEIYEKEPVYSWFQNLYNDRTRRSAMKALLKERIDADMQELTVLDALELDEIEVSDEQQDFDGEGVIETASSFGQTGNVCSSSFHFRP